MPQSSSTPPSRTSSRDAATMLISPPNQIEGTMLEETQEEEEKQTEPPEGPAKGPGKGRGRGRGGKGRGRGRGRAMSLYEKVKSR